MKETYGRGASLLSLDAVRDTARRAARKVPLRMVAAYVQLLAKDYQGQFSAEADEYIAFAVERARRM